MSLLKTSKNTYKTNNPRIEVQRYKGYRSFEYYLVIDGVEKSSVCYYSQKQVKEAIKEMNT